MSSKKGDKWERRYRNVLSASTLQEFLDAHDFGVSDYAFVKPFTAVRMPSSGSAVPFDLPDLHIWHKPVGDDDVDQFAAEVKAGRERAEFRRKGGDGGVPALRRYADATGAKPIAFIHIDYEGDFVVGVDDLHDAGKSHTFTETRDVGRDCVDDFGDWVESPNLTL